MAAKLLLRERSAGGIYFFVWLDFRWIGSKPCNVWLYPEDMRFIKSQLMQAWFLGIFCALVCVYVFMCVPCLDLN